MAGGSKGKSKDSKASSRPKDRDDRAPSKTAEKEAKRRLAAMERQISKRMRESERPTLIPSPPRALSAPNPPSPPLDLSLSSSRHQTLPSSVTVRRAPEATFTPTAAGLRDEVEPPEDIPDRTRAWMERAIRQGIASGLQQSLRAIQRPSLHTEVQSVQSQDRQFQVLPQGSFFRDQVLPEPELEEEDIQDQMDLLERGSGHDTDLSSLEADPLEGGMSEDEGLTPDVPIFSGLFRPQMFRSILFKAKNTAQLNQAASSASSNPSQDHPGDPIFFHPTVEADVVPVPHMFIESFRQQWALAAVYPAPTGYDRKHFNLDPEFSRLLDVPQVDDPIVGLVSSSAILGGSEEVLKPEDRRSELAMRKAHQSNAWAVKTTPLPPLSALPLSGLMNYGTTSPPPTREPTRTSRS